MTSGCFAGLAFSPASTMPELQNVEHAKRIMRTVDIFVIDRFLCVVLQLHRSPKKCSSETRSWNEMVGYLKPWGHELAGGPAQNTQRLQEGNSNTHLVAICRLL